MTSKDKLTPCDCGQGMYRWSYTMVADRDPMRVSVQCMSCGQCSAMCRTKAEAVKSWNSRQKGEKA